MLRLGRRVGFSCGGGGVCGWGMVWKGELTGGREVENELVIPFPLLRWFPLRNWC